MKGIVERRNWVIFCKFHDEVKIVFRKQLARIKIAILFLPASCVKCITLNFLNLNLELIYSGTIRNHVSQNMKTRDQNEASQERSSSVMTYIQILISLPSFCSADQEDLCQIGKFPLCKWAINNVVIGIFRVWRKYARYSPLISRWSSDFFPCWSWNESVRDCVWSYERAILFSVDSQRGVMMYFKHLAFIRFSHFKWQVRIFLGISAKWIRLYSLLEKIMRK